MKRDRVADLLRVLAILVVVLGHWIAIVVHVVDDAIVLTRLTAIIPWAAWGTWAFQVIPLFFLVGGLVNAGSWERAQARGEPWAAWVQRRAARLLGPITPLLLVWLALVPTLLAAGFRKEEVEAAAHGAFLPLWFLGVYAAVVALAPLTLRLHRRAPSATLLGLAFAIAVADALGRAGVPFAARANTLLVWACIHQIGYLWHDGALPRRARAGLAWAALGLLALVALVAFAGYPVSMVALAADDDHTNANPPTLALLALALVQLGLVIAVRRRLARTLERPRAWRWVGVAGRATLTILVWHVTAMILVVALTYPTHLWPAGGRVDATWWALRPLWILLCTFALAGLVLLFHRFEARAPRRVGEPAHPARTVLGLALALAGVGILVTRGLYDPEAPWVHASGASLALLGGLALMGALPGRASALLRPARGAP